MTSTIRCGLVALLMVPTGCADSDATAERGVVRSDSAGVEIVRIGREALARVPETTLVEALRVGTREGGQETSFFRLSGMHLLPDGRVVVLDRGNGLVKVFGADGEFIRSLGRAGDGPGEFQSPYGLAVLGDTVMVLDRLLHLFSLDGSHLSSIRPPLPDATYLWSVSASEGGWLGEVRGSGLPGAGPEGWARLPTSVVRLHRQSLHPTDTVATVLGPRTYRLGPAQFHVEPLFEPQPRAVLTSGGTWVVRDGSYRLEFVDASGQLRRILEADPEPTPIGSEAVDAYLASETDRVRRMPASSERDLYRETMLERRLELPTPEAMPVIGRVIASTDAGLLVERLDLDPSPFDPGNGTWWDLILPDGVPAGRLHFDTAFRPMALDGTRIWGVGRDDLDVEYVVALDAAVETASRRD